MKEYKLVKLDRYDNGVVLVTLQNGPLNLMSPDLLFELRDLFKELSEDVDMRAVVLTGNTRSFCAGADVTSFGVFHSSFQPAALLPPRSRAPYQPAPNRW